MSNNDFFIQHQIYQIDQPSKSNQSQYIGSKETVKKDSQVKMFKFGTKENEMQQNRLWENEQKKIINLENYRNRIHLMSTSYYNESWEQAISNLLQCIEEENLPLNENKNDKGITYKKSDLEWFQYYAAIYLRYLETYRKLEEAYDRMIHPQKRILMKQMLDNTMVRMCEVKQNIVRYSTHTNIVQSDFVNIDQILMDMKLTPKALKIPLPRFVHDTKSTRDLTIQKIVRQLGISEEVESIHDRVTLDTNMETAIRIIQKLERGRQGIVRGHEYNKLRNKFQKDRSAQIENQQEQRVIIVQKYWRAFLGRRQAQKLKEEQMKFLGIQKAGISINLLQAVEQQRKKLKVFQKNKAQIFQKDKEKIKNQIKKTQEPTIKANMLDKRRKWIKKFLEMHEFISLPSNAEQFYKKKQVKEEETGQKKPKDKKEDTKAKGSKKNDVQKFLDQHIGIGPTEEVVKLQQKIKQYTEVWGSRDPTEVMSENYDIQLAKDQMRPQIQDELEKLIDGVINLELDNMRIKYGIKKKKDKKKKKKKRKEKKVKIPQGLAKKDPKDLLEELFEKNIAKLLAGSKMDDFLGQHNTITYMIQKNSEQLPDPALSQVRNLVAEYIGIPLSSKYAKEKLQKWSWFLFYGATGTGKTMLLRALHKQTNAIVFDLTPEIVKQKYTEKAELTRLIWSTIICAKQYQPSIIMIDDFETIFSGVKPKKGSGTSSFGSKMKKVMGDMKKNKLWTKNDQIAVIACTNKPYDANIKDMKKMFDKKMYFPYPNYATRKLLIRNFIEEKCKMKINDFPYETFAHVTEGFTAGSFKATIDKVLTPFRIERLKDEPLKLSELVNPLSNSICVFAEEYEKIRKFTDEVMGLKERREAKKEPNKAETKDNKKQVKKQVF